MNKNNQLEEIVSLTYKIMRLAHKSLKTGESPTSDLSLLQIRALNLISEKPLTMSEIAQQLNIKLPTATSLIDRLYIADLIERVDDSKDRRKVLIKLNVKGKKMLQQSTRLLMKKASYLLKDLSNEDKQNLYQILVKVYQMLEKGKNK